MALAQLVAAVIDELTLTNWGAPPDYESGGQEFESLRARQF